MPRLTASSSPRSWSLADLSLVKTLTKSTKIGHMLRLTAPCPVSFVTNRSGSRMFCWQKWETDGVDPADYCSRQLLQTAIGDLSFCMNRARGLHVLKQARRFCHVLTVVQWQLYSALLKLGQRYCGKIMNQNPRLLQRSALSQYRGSLELELEDHGRQFAAIACSRLHIYLKDAIRQFRRKVKWCILRNGAQLLSLALHTEEQRLVQTVLCKSVFVLVLEVSMSRDKFLMFLEVVPADTVSVTMTRPECPSL